MIENNLKKKKSQFTEAHGFHLERRGWKKAVLWG